MKLESMMVAFGGCKKTLGGPGSGLRLKCSQGRCEKKLKIVGRGFVQRLLCRRPLLRANEKDATEGGSGLGF